MINKSFNKQELIFIDWLKENAFFDSNFDNDTCISFHRGDIRVYFDNTDGSTKYGAHHFSVNEFDQYEILEHEASIKTDSLDELKEFINSFSDGSTDLFYNIYLNHFDNGNGFDRFTGEPLLNYVDWIKDGLGE